MVQKIRLLKGILRISEEGKDFSALGSELNVASLQKHLWTEEFRIAKRINDKKRIKEAKIKIEKWTNSINEAKQAQQKILKKIISKKRRMGKSKKYWK